MNIWQQDWIAKWAVYSPKKIALKDFETNVSLTYLELNRLGNKTAIYLTKELKLSKGDRIAIVAENSVEQLILFVAAQKTGIILVPINYRLTSSEIDYLFKVAEPKIIISDKSHLKTVQHTSYGKTNSTKLFSWEQLHTVFDKKQIDEDFDYFKITPVQEDDPIFILFTSGTTGFPKGALYTHKMLFWNSINTAFSLVINTETRTLNCMPLFHTGGWNVLITPVLHHGGYLVLMRSFSAGAVLKLIEEEKLTIYMGVPTMLKMMVEESAFEQTDYSSILYFIVGGEAMPIPLIEKWNEKGVAIRQGYGLTEVGPNLTSLHQKDAIRKKGSIGRPNFYVQIKIVDKETCEVSKCGELLLRGPMVTPGYWKDKTATKEAIKDGWFHTGDVVETDEQDYLYVVDRYKNMYISGGENVYPAEVERVLCKHPAIIEAAVVSIKDNKWGEVGKAFIVSNSKLSENEILAFCKEHLAKFKIPKQILFLKELPKNDTGKVNRIILKNIN